MMWHLGADLFGSHIVEIANIMHLAMSLAVLLSYLCIMLAVYLGMNLYYQKVKKTYRPLSTYTTNSKNTESGPFTADLDSAEEV